MKSLRVLVGDDQIGIPGSLHQKAFLRNYEGLADFEFEYDPQRFIEKSKINNYDALLIDLNWEQADAIREYKTGFRVLEAVKDFSPIRLLHTSDDELRRKGIQYGATDCIEKNRGRVYLNNYLKGGEEK